MNIVVDGIIYQLQARGGISRIFNEILPRMCRIDDALEISLLMTDKSKQVLPQYPRLRIHSAPRIASFLKPQRFWQPIVEKQQARWLRKVIGETEGKIWHSTYYTMPDGWRGQQVVTVADMASELFPDTFDASGAVEFREHKRSCVLAADAVICISEVTRQDVLHQYGIDAGKTHVVLLAYGDIFRQLPEESLQVSLPVREPFLLYVGSRVHYKNFRLLLEAYAAWGRCREVALLVVGGGEWSPQEKEILVRFGLTERVQLIPDTDDISLCKLYNRAAAFLYPSLYEGFGIPLLEAMACGCPVIASHIPATVEVAGDCPVYFELGETENLVLVLDKTLSEGRYSPQVKAGLERVKKFSWDRTAWETVQIYRRLLSTG
ncbi:glycosyltransferase family 4 protein [Chloroflexota bacterium]